MYSIQVRNVNTGLTRGLQVLRDHGVIESSRAGPVSVVPVPVMTTYAKPTERVLFSAQRDANPFFHFMEGLWMLAGHDDLRWVEKFNSRFGQFSDNGRTIHGAYGHRWRQHFGFDQLRIVAEELHARPDSRRAVLSMWSPNADLRAMVDRPQMKDVPCNTHIYFDRRGGALNMTVCCRSNDALWGCYGANAVHMSMLHEFMAGWLGTPVGLYHQFSNNLHAYLEMPGYPDVTKLGIPDDRYDDEGIKPYPMVQVGASAFRESLTQFMDDPLFGGNYSEPFFHEVAAPMYSAWEYRKRGIDSGMPGVDHIQAVDWRLACGEWIKRREAERGRDA